MRPRDTARHPQTPPESVARQRVCELKALALVDLAQMHAQEVCLCGGAAQKHSCDGSF
jgi:CDGSH-type Zn-finger protein